MKRKLKIVLFSMVISMFSVAAFAVSTEQLAQRAQNAATVLGEIATIPDKTIPTSLLKAATCIATIPNVVRAGFIFGGRMGKGLASCRVAGGWSDPSYVTITGGSWGLQIGVDSTDLVLVFVRPNAIDRLSNAQFTIGGDASVAVGPVGRDAEVGTDYQLDSDVYAYARSRGLFGGLTLSGNLLSVDTGSNTAIYAGTVSDTKAILTRAGQNAPAVVMPYVTALMTYAPAQ